MAKRRNHQENTMNTEATENTEVATENTVVEGTAAVVAPDKSDDRFKTVKHPKSGETVKRIDYIRELWATKQYTRGAIAKHLSEITGKTVPYQIVFAATKGIEGGPAKEADAIPATGSDAPTAE